MSNLHSTLVTKNEARKRLGISTGRFAQLVAAGKLPGPLDPDSPQPVWSWVEIEASLDERGRTFARRGAA